MQFICEADQSANLGIFCLFGRGFHLEAPTVTRTLTPNKKNHLQYVNLKIYWCVTNYVGGTNNDVTVVSDANDEID